MSKPLSKELRAQLQRWINWVDMGAPIGGGFYRWHALCDACWLLKDMIVSQELLKLLEEDHDGDSCNAFGDRDVFDKERETGTMHLNKKRIAWVRRKLADVQERVSDGFRNG